MQAFGIVNGNPNITVTTFMDEQDWFEVEKGATRDDGSFCSKTAKKIEIARAKRRLAAQGALETKFFPV